MIVADPGDRRLCFAFSGLPREVMPGVEAIEAFLLRAGCAAAGAQKVAMAAEEILTNIARHAWGGGGCGYCAVEVTAVGGDGGVHVCLRTEDDGVAFDPTRAKVRDLGATLEERSVGGLGIVLIRTLTDAQRYQRVAARNVFEVTAVCARERG